MPNISSEFLPLLIPSLLGWALGWLVLRSGRVSVFPALSTALLFLVGQDGRLGDLLGNPSDPLAFVVPISVLALALWSVARSSLQVIWRVLLSNVLVPPLVVSVELAVVLWFLKQIP